jgi:hypothetical protein
MLLISALGLTMVVGGFLYLFFGGLPFDFVVPFVNVRSLADGLFFVVVIAVAVYIGVVGLRELVVERRFSVEFLMAVAGLGAVYLGLFFEAATVLFLYSLAEYFEGYIQDRARRTVEKLSSFMPNKARVLVDGSETSVNVGDVQTGMTLLVKPGERIPLDGNVIDGSLHAAMAEEYPAASAFGGVKAEPIFLLPVKHPRSSESPCHETPWQHTVSHELRCSSLSHLRPTRTSRCARRGRLHDDGDPGECRLSQNRRHGQPSFRTVSRLVCRYHKPQRRCCLCECGS